MNCTYLSPKRGRVGQQFHPYLKSGKNGCCKYCRVIPKDGVTTQHRVVVLDICIRNNMTPLKKSSYLNYAKSLQNDFIHMGLPNYLPGVLDFDQ